MAYMTDNEWLFVNSWGKTEKRIVTLQAIASSCRLFLIIDRLMRKYMQNTITKAFEVSVTVSIAFKNFDFVVAAFSKAVCDSRRKRIKNTC